MRLIAFAKLLVLLSFLLLGDYYLLTYPSFRVTAFSLFFLMAVYYLFEKPVLLGIPTIPMRSETRSLVIYSCALLGYFSIFSFVRDQDVESIWGLVVGIPMMMALPVFENNRDRFNVPKVYAWLMAVSIAFAFLQVLGFGQNLGTLVPNLLIMNSDNFINEATLLGERVAGATSSVVGFAENVSILIIFGYFLLREKLTKWRAAGFLACVVILFFTQVRNAIYGLLPAILFCEIVFHKRKIGSLIKAVFISAVVVVSFLGIERFLQDRFGYLTREIVSSDTNRFKVNYIMTKGVLKEAPWFGISQAESWALYLRHSDDLSFLRHGLGTIEGTPTHHNQIGYYIRYYGLVGLALWLVLVWLIFRKAMKSPDPTVKSILAGIFIFDLIYSLGHNNKILNNPVLWVLLSLAGTGIHGHQAPAASEHARDLRAS